VSNDYWDPSNLPARGGLLARPIEAAPSEAADILKKKKNI
jgi:hypothetical protein